MRAPVVVLVSFLTAFAVGLGAVEAFGGSSAASTIDTMAGQGHAPRWWTADDYRELASLGGDIQSSGPDLLLIMDSESGLNPAARFPKVDAAGHSLAVGISQLTKASDPLTGLSDDQRDALSSESVAAQLPIVRRYFERLAWTKLGRPYPTAGVLYAMNFLPSRALARGVAPETVLGTVDEFPLDSHLADAAGNYTVASLDDYLRTHVATGATYLGALQAMRDATGDQTLSPRLA
jgi:hypothetical protein